MKRNKSWFQHQGTQAVSETQCLLWECLTCPCPPIHPGLHTQNGEQYINNSFTTYFLLQLSLSHAFLFKIIVLNWLKSLFYSSSTQSLRDTSRLSRESSFQTSQVKTLQSASTSAADQTQQSIDYIPPTPPTPKKSKVARVSPHTEVMPPHFFQAQKTSCKVT